ncbi:MAG TPA: hypothetical protein VMU29_15025 [Smithella sp.]|nr:hypothetical protein [Smithella sp.]
MDKNIKIILALMSLVVLGAIIISISLLWQKRRKKGIIETGKSLGFRNLGAGEKMPVVFVPLIDRADRKYFIILRGLLNGYEAAYFDLVVQAGKDWFYQSVVMVKNPKVDIPMFQLKAKPWMTQSLTQKTCGEALEVPNREKDMGVLQLSSKDPQWAMQTISGASPQFFQKLQKGHWTIEGFQHSLFIYSWGRTIYPGEMRDFVREAGEIAQELYSLCS